MCLSDVSGMHRVGVHTTTVTSDEHKQFMQDLTTAILESQGGKSPKLDQVIDDALGGDTWFDKFKKAQSTY